MNDISKQILAAAKTAARENGTTIEKMRGQGLQRLERDSRNAALWQVRKQFIECPANTIADVLGIKRKTLAHAIEHCMNKESAERVIKWSMPGEPSENYKAPQHESNAAKIEERVASARQVYFERMIRPVGQRATRRMSILEKYAMAEF